MVPGSVDPSVREELDELREHDREVLEFLSQDPSSLVAFQGIRRRLRIHPEKLSRALHRLSRDELVDRTDLGYRITSKALAILSPGSLALARDVPAFPILQTYLPTDLDLRQLVLALKGSWIGALRWYGITDAADELRLSWATDDGAVQLDARLRVGQLTIAAVVGSAERLDEATRLGHLLFQHIARELSRGSVPGLSG
jgi:DNA-binding Lrp family transcriptional regulator